MKKVLSVVLISFISLFSTTGTLASELRGDLLGIFYAPLDEFGNTIISRDVLDYLIEIDSTGKNTVVTFID